MESTDIALLILRGWLGIVIMAHGINHGRSLDGTTSWFASLGWQRARLQAMLSAVAEIAIGVALIVGLLTSIAAAGLVATMFVAYLSNHRPNGFFIFRPGEGWEYVATIAFASDRSGNPRRRGSLARRRDWSGCSDRLDRSHHRCQWIRRRLAAGRDVLAQTRCCVR